MCEQVTVEVRKKSAFQARRFYWIRNHPRGPLEISVPKEKCSNGPSFSFWRGKRGKVPDILWLWFCQVLHHMRASSHFHMHLKNVHLQTELKPLGMVESSGALSSNTWIGWRVSRWGSHPWWFRLHNGLLRQARLFEADSDSLSSFMKSSCSYSHHFLRTYLGARNCFRGFPCLLSPLSSGPYGKVSLASSSVQSLKTRVRLFASTWTAAARPPCSSPTPRVYSNSCPSSQWCHPTILSSVVPFSSCLQSFPGSGSFPMSQLFASGGHSVGVSGSGSVTAFILQLRKSGLREAELPKATWSASAGARPPP